SVGRGSISLVGPQAVRRALLGLLAVISLGVITLVVSPANDHGWFAPEFWSFELFTIAALAAAVAAFVLRCYWAFALTLLAPLLGLRTAQANATSLEFVDWSIFDLYVMKVALVLVVALTVVSYRRRRGRVDRYVALLAGGALVAAVVAYVAGSAASVLW